MQIEKDAKCYLLTARGTLMPATYGGPVFETGRWFEQVRSLEGRLYTCRQENVLTEDEGRAMRTQRRAEQLTAEGYRVSLRLAGNAARYRIYSEEKHGPAGGYILMEILPGIFSCSCPAYEKHCECKHSEGLPGLLHSKAHEARKAGKDAHAETYHALAVGAHLHREAHVPTPQPAAAIDHSLAERRAWYEANVNRDF